MADQAAQDLDSILEESFGGQAATLEAADAKGFSIEDICKYWQYIRAFLTWAQGQTKNPIAKIIIGGLITLGDRRCANS